jgi:hypothetical protein
LLHKIHELEEKLLETQLQLERVTDEKLTHMLSIQKSPTDKSGLGYVAPPYDIPSTSRTVFVKPAVPEPLPTVEDKGKDKINGDVPSTQKPPTIRKSPICHHCGLRVCLTPVLPPQSSKSKGQEKSSQTSKLRHKTSGPASDSMASGSLSSSLSSPMTSRPKASCPKAPGSSTSAASAKICSCKSKGQIEVQQIQALQKAAEGGG